MYEKTLSRKTVFEGRILSVDVLDVELETGQTSVREIVQHGAAVAIITQLLDGRFVFIRQFRKAMERICFEVVAGNCDPGEEAAVSAVRELKEETGYIAESLELLGPIFPSVGYCTERIDIYFAQVSEQGETDFDEDERIETVILTEGEVDQMIRENQVADAKTLAAWMLFKAKICG
jgi:ADP-ribose pyrophosphatase